MGILGLFHRGGRLLSWGLALLLSVGVAMAAERSYRFDIAAQPLGGALTAFGKATGIQLIYPAGLVAGRQSPGARGEQSATQALSALLAGTGVQFQFIDAASVRLTPAGDALQLGPVRVEGAIGETAWGPVQGYAAKRSATGTKTDTPIIETPQSLSVITSDQIQTRSALTLSDVLAYTPGVMASDRGHDSRFDWSTIRGISGPAYDITFRDGIKMPNTSFAIPHYDPYAVERVEVLRGPASILYGSNSPGGLINLVTKRPTAAPVGELRLQAGSRDFWSAGFDVGGPLDEGGQYLYRVTGLARAGDTEVQHSDEERWFLAPSFTWQAGENTSLTLLTDLQKDNNDGQGFPRFRYTIQGLDQLPADFFYGEPGIDHYDRDQYSIGYVLEHRFNGTWSLHQRARYLSVETDYRYTSLLGANAAGLIRRAEIARDEVKTRSIDTYVSADWTSGPIEHTSLLGVDYLGWKTESNTGTSTMPPLDPITLNYGQPFALPAALPKNDNDASQLGVYLQDQWRFGQWVALFSGRYDRFENDAGGLQGGSWVESTEDDDAFTGRAGLVYLFDNGIAPYASYSESFEPQTGRDRNNSSFEPTTGEQWEVGVRYEPAGGNARYSAAVFDLRKQNVLTEDPLGPVNGRRVSVQTGEIRSRGLELEATANLAMGLNLIGAYTYLDAETTKSNTLAEVGKRPGNVPKHNASLWLDYTIGGGALRGLGFGLGVRYVGETAHQVSRLESEAYTLADALIRYRRERWQLALNVNNLFDREADVFCAAAGCRITESREVVGTLSYGW